MDGINIALLGMTMVFAAGGAWLLWQRSALAMRAAVAEEAASMEGKRREMAEEALTARGVELAEIGRLLGEAQKSAAVLGTRVEQGEAERAREREESVKHEREAVAGAAALHAQTMEGAKKEFDARLETLSAARNEIEKRLTQFETLMKTTFGSLAGEALRESSGQFLKLAKESLEAEHQKAAGEIGKSKLDIQSLVKPITETLSKTDAKLAEIQQQWTADRVTITEQVRGVGAAHELLRMETTKLVKALGKPEVRGRYGEVQLRRVAELAGMNEYCDFIEQASARDDEGRLLRPDMVVKLPNGREIAVDAKTNIAAYVEAMNFTEEGDQKSSLERFARHVAEQARDLGGKRYWSHYSGSPEFVVMFVPGDQFLDAALRLRPELFETAAQAGVVLATPSSLIGLLLAVAKGFQERRIAAHAEELNKLVVELHKRFGTALDHLLGVGTAINKAAEKYNQFVASYERMVLPKVREIESAGAKSGNEVALLKEVTTLANVRGGVRAEEG